MGSTDNNLYAIGPDGSEKWRYSTDGPVYSSPAVGADGTIYVGSDDKRLYAINPNGSLKWRYITAGTIRSSPAVGPDGTIYVGSGWQDSKLYAMNPGGTLKWSFTTGYWVNSSPAVGADGIVYFGSSDDKLYAVGPSGTLKWSLATGDQITSSPAIGVDGTIYVGSNDGRLYAITEAETEGGACFIATAAYGTPMADEVGILREFRDEYLVTNPAGQALVGLYYRVSPPIAEFITEHPGLKPIVRAGLLPAVAMSTIAVNTSLIEKAAVLSLLVLVSLAAAVWSIRHCDRGPEHSRR